VAAPEDDHSPTRAVHYMIDMQRKWGEYEKDNSKWYYEMTVDRIVLKSAGNNLTDWLINDFGAVLLLTNLSVIFWTHYRAAPELSSSF